MSRPSNDLLKKWEKKLEESGFIDIEKQRSGRQWHDRYYRWRYTPEEFQEKLYYYQLAERFLNEFEFEKEIHKKIWELHSKGTACREIYILTQWKSKSTIHLLIKNLRKIMIGLY